MFTVILLAATMGQLSASDGPPRQWLPGVIGGRTVQIWGWRDASGGVGYKPQENHHIYPQFALKPAAPVALNAGLVLESNGTLNSGLDLGGVRPTVGLDTNDRELLTRLSSDAGSPCPSPGPRLPGPLPIVDPSLAPLPYRDYLVPAAILVAALLIVGFGVTRRQS